MRIQSINFLLAIEKLIKRKLERIEIDDFEPRHSLPVGKEGAPPQRKNHTNNRQSPCQSRTADKRAPRKPFGNDSNKKRTVGASGARPSVSYKKSS